MMMLFNFLKYVVFGTFILTIVGFVWFAEHVDAVPKDLTSKTDAIVVLTGGSNRVEKGFELLHQEFSKNLFITGVYKRLSLSQLMKRHGISQNSACCVDLGYQAEDTVGNAKETAIWANNNKVKSIRLVTSKYHMPRALIEFNKYMASTNIIPHPVSSDRFFEEDWWYWPGTLSLMIREYLKYIYVKLSSQPLKLLK